MEPPRMTHLNGWDENWNGVWSTTMPFAWNGMTVNVQSCLAVTFV
ncbi:hypothetical protein AVEN_103881-1, partial [Araneus ventricosus]